MTDNSSPADPDPDGQDSLGELLAAAFRPDAPDPAGERQALAAFRAVRDAGSQAGKPRRRDDWRPRRRRTRWSLRTMVSGLFVGLTVGGVAVAGIGTGSAPAADPERPLPSRNTTHRPAPAVSAQAPGADSAHPERARDQKARCTSYEAGHGVARSERAAAGCGTPSATSSKKAQSGQGKALSNGQGKGKGEKK